MARSGLILPAYISRGMIIQQNQPFILRGKAEPLAAIRVALSRVPADNRPISPLDPEYGVIFEADAAAGEQGGFSITLPALAASFDPLTLVLVSGGSRIVIDDILIGEVWLAIGGDNLAYPVRAAANSQQLLEQANTPYVRFLVSHGRAPDTPPHAPAARSQVPDFPPPELSADFIGGRWLDGDESEAMADRSATAFVFARELCQELHLPVAILDQTMRGLRLDDLLPGETPGVQPEKPMTSEPDASVIRPAGSFYQSRLAPLEGLAVRGVLWQLGESDYHQPARCAKGMKNLVDAFNRLFRPASERLDLIIAQLPPFFTGQGKTRTLARFNEMLAASRQDWACRSALISVYDLPPEYADAPEPWNRPHTPRSKQPVGHRMKLVACGMVYQRKAPASAPECAEIETVGNKFMISFSQTGAGLRLSGDDGRLRGFSICGPDRVFMEASARLLYGLRVLVWHDQIARPVAVSYADLDLNVNANLLSRDGLSVVPFRSDREPAHLAEPLEWTHCEQLEIWAVPAGQPEAGSSCQPLFMPGRGRVALSVERNNKSEGDGSLYLRYETDAQKLASFRPVLDYASLYPPLDLAPFDTLMIDVFNPDQQFKSLTVEVMPEPVADTGKLATEGAGEASSAIELSGASESGTPERVSLGSVTIEPALRWQTLRFAISRLPAGSRHIRELTFTISDRKGKGQLFVDNIRLLLP